ncbi:MAG: 7,8-dihydroneopterin aldolase/epimerase/oxygenase [Gaiellales bacterium]|nr:7,8-dihydroneopterin aldolase/epimerase/oxygenase [Gaiellales bacterium]MDX6592194.1 7,8-dihydroneopterin aldolase/epimerase/oxygenase [Gaiellales bacterium]
MSVPVIELRGLEVFAYHGVHAEEKERGQTFFIDVVLESRFADATRSDRLEDAIDYGAVADRVVELAGGGPYDLLERLAAVIADDLMATFAAARVAVTVHKPQAPITHPFTDVAVTVERRA